LHDCRSVSRIYGPYSTLRTEHRGNVMCTRQQLIIKQEPHQTPSASGKPESAAATEYQAL